MATIAFKLEHTVRELRVQPEATYPFEYGGPTTYASSFSVRRKRTRRAGTTR